MARKTSVETKTAETKAAAVKTTAKKTTTKAAAKTEEKAPAKKPAARKTAAKKPALKSEVFVQYWGKEISAAEVVETVKNLWVSEMGKSLEDLKDIQVYIKPEDNGAHYVINGEVTGFIAL